MRWHVPAPSGSTNGTVRPGRSSPAWQGVCCNSVPPCSNLFLLSSLSAFHQWGCAVKMRSCWSCCHSSKVSVVAPVPAEHLPTWQLQLAMVVPHRNRKVQQTSVGSCLWLSPPAPTQLQTLEAEGLLLWLSWSQRQSAAVWWLSLTCLLLLSDRALNHFVLFHPITWIHFKLWNSPFLPWLICEICHLSFWFMLCPS